MAHAINAIKAITQSAEENVFKKIQTVSAFFFLMDHAFNAKQATRKLRLQMESA